MINYWRHGGFTGSIDGLANKMVKDYLQKSPTINQLNYRVDRQFIRKILAGGTFGYFVFMYLVANVTVIATEYLCSINFSNGLSLLSANLSLSKEKEELMLGFTGFLIMTQVGVLTVISLAFAVAAIFANVGAMAIQMRGYLYVSMAYEIVGSSMALIAVLIAQLTWPRQTIYYRYVNTSENYLMEPILFGIHCTWLLLNLVAITYFMITSFKVIEGSSSRSDIRDYYYAVVSKPHDINLRWREKFYQLAKKKLCPAFVAFGEKRENAGEIVIDKVFKKPLSLYDVRMSFVKCAVRRWRKRCVKKARNSTILSDKARMRNSRLWFTVEVNKKMHGTVDWCQSNGGEPLNGIERFILRCAFRFRRHHNDQ